MSNNTKPEPGFYPLPKWDICNDLNHLPPSHMVIPYGMFYLHVCPGCGKEQKVFSAEIYCQDKGNSTC